MKIKKILKIHDEYLKRPSMIAGNLGDGYLLEKNSIYKNIRDAVLKSGFKLSGKRFFNYDALALTQLPKLLSEKIIPYTDNVSALREIECMAPGQFTLNEIPPLRGNYLLHESAHGVARSLRNQHLKKMKQENGREKNRDLAFAVMFEESFSNACESFFNLEATTEVHQQFLYKNTYVIETKPARARLQVALDQIGATAAFRLILLSYLHSNFLKTEIASKEFARVLAIVLWKEQKIFQKLSKTAIQQLKQAFQTGFELDPAFTHLTNAFCLRLMGIRDPLPELLAFDFLERFEIDDRYLNCLQVMSEVAILKA